jgi:rare lipoprotein A
LRVAWAAVVGGALLIGAASGCAPRALRKGDFIGEGLASYYGKGFHGRKTANGERFDKGAMTAAHRTLRFNSCVTVVHAVNGRSVEVRVNDRGPYSGGRIIDPSEAAARRLGMIESGVARVRLYRC